MTARPSDASGLAIAAAQMAVFLLLAWVSVAPSHINVQTALLWNALLSQAPPIVLSLALHLTTPELQGVVVVALMWGAWFARLHAEARARMISGIVGAVAAAALAHVLQHSFPSPPKPLFLPEFDAPERLRAFFGSYDPAVMSAHSFPSERGTLFAGLAWVTFVAARRTGGLALAFTALVEIARVLVGLHYVADIVASICLAGAFVFVCSLPACVKCGRAALCWEESAPSSFYSVAFVLSYQLITTFDFLRWSAQMIIRKASG